MSQSLASSLSNNLVTIGQSRPSSAAQKKSRKSLQIQIDVTNESQNRLKTSKAVKGVLATSHMAKIEIID